VKKSRSLMYCVALLLTVWGPLAAQIPLSLPRLSANPGATVRIPVTVGDLTGTDVTSFGFVVSCDTTIIRLTGTEQEGTLSSGLMMFANNHVRPFTPGKMKVVCASARPISGKGVLVYLTGIVQKKSGSSGLQLSECLLNAGSPPARSSDGSIKIVAAAVDKIINPRDTLARKK
jgi:hypothetical protein